MLYFVIFAGVVIAFIVYNNKRATEKEETLRRENAARSTVRPEDILTEEGIPKRMVPRQPSMAQAQSDFLKKPEQTHVAYRAPDKSATKNIANEQLTKTPTYPLAMPPSDVPKKEFLSVDLPDNKDQAKNTAVSGGQRIYSAYVALLDKRYEPEDKTLIRFMLSNKESCTICGQPTVPGETRVTLSNGLHVHRSCYVTLCAHVKKYKSDAEIPAPGTKDFEVMRRLIITNQYWPTYPDDWEQRKSLVIKDSEYECESCGEDSLPLHVHHIQELSAGGSNAPDNLQCLCENCHDELHNGLLSKNIDIQRGKNRTKIDDAINNGKNIEFTYKDTKGNYTRRTAKPLRYMRTPHGAPAVRAFCYLRNEERTFVIRKMSKMKIL